MEEQQHINKLDFHGFPPPAGHQVGSALRGSSEPYEVHAIMFFILKLKRVHPKVNLSVPKLTSQ